MHSSGGASRIERRRVLFVDTDAGGRIHFTAALRWAEAVEHRLIRDLDPGSDIGGWPRRHVEAAYHLPLGFDDEVEVHLQVAQVGTSSVRWRWRLERDGQTCVEGGHTTVHVGVDGAPQSCPNHFAPCCKTRPPRRRRGWPGRRSATTVRERPDHRG